jgi:hypothetical protein
VTGPVDQELIDLLVGRDGITTEVVLRDAKRLRVVNIAWGYDDGDAHAHITTNISPFVAEAAADFFFTSKVVTVVDPLTGDHLLEPSW